MCASKRCGAPMIVCVCNRISDREITRRAQQGCSSFDELQMETGVATCCGRCEDCARTVFDDASSRGWQRLDLKPSLMLASAA
ncbi:MAG: (2Fe-2S)-binding protein [Aquabacterium sp.]|uniref:(2Fe-2S)-binding protein n=1 Tax=Aquabacterium sp. TaxID=1872578 RepID=UPI003BD4F968